MVFSDTVAQQRERQEKSLKRFIAYSLMGSVVLHGVFLLLRVQDFKQSDTSEPEEIAIVVTEPEEELEEVIPPEESEPVAESDAEPSGGAGDVDAATIVEAPPPQASAPQPVEEPVVQEEPTPAPSPVPIAEDLEEPVPAEPETPPAEPTEQAEATPPRNLSNLLEELRRARQQTGRTTTTNNSNRPSAASSSPSPNGNGSAGEGNSTAAARSARPGSGEGREAGEGTGNGSGRGSQSREISCEGCDFDYPEEADGAEGTAQVVVETDDEGRVVSVMLSRTSGNAALDQAALEQAREQVRLNNARAGESYPIDIDFVQPNSEAAERVRERGDRRSITITEPEQEVVETPETPSNAANQPLEQPSPISPSPSSPPLIDSSPVDEPNETQIPSAEGDAPAIPASPDASVPDPAPPAEALPPEPLTPAPVDPAPPVEPEIEAPPLEPPAGDSAAPLLEPVPDAPAGSPGS